MEHVVYLVSVPSAVLEPGIEKNETLPRSNFRISHPSRILADRESSGKPSTIEDLCIVDARTHPVLTPSLAPPEYLDIEAIQAIYQTTYAPGLDKLLETQWFSEKGFSNLVSDTNLLADFGSYIGAVHSISTTAVTLLAAIETRLVWSLLCMCRTSSGIPVANHVTGIRGVSSFRDEEALVCVPRLDVLEALITGESLAPNQPGKISIESPASCGSSRLGQQLKGRELDFWHTIGQYLGVPPISESTVAAEDHEPDPFLLAEALVAHCRSLLDTFENRDVIYSILVLRHLGERWAGSTPESSTEPELLKAQQDWVVARGFLEAQAEGRGSTNPVISRFCSMALRAWRE